MHPALTGGHTTGTVRCSRRLLAQARTRPVAHRDIARARGLSPLNLEHGGIVINHNLTDAGSVARLNEFVQTQPGFPGCFIVQPHDAVSPGEVVLTAWGLLQRYDGMDSEGMQRFIDTHRNQGPERLGSSCGG